MGRIADRVAPGGCRPRQGHDSGRDEAGPGHGAGLRSRREHRPLARAARRADHRRPAVWYQLAVQVGSAGIPMSPRRCARRIEYFSIDHAKGGDWYRAHFPMTLRRRAAAATGRPPRHLRSHTRLSVRSEGTRASAGVGPRCETDRPARETRPTGPYRTTTSTCGWGDEPLDLEGALRSEEDRLTDEWVRVRRGPDLSGDPVATLLVRGEGAIRRAARASARGCTPVANSSCFAARTSTPDPRSVSPCPWLSRSACLGAPRVPQLQLHRTLRRDVSGSARHGACGSWPTVTPNPPAASSICSAKSFNRARRRPLNGL